MRVIVTGGAGFIGSAVVRHLVLQTGATVLTVDKLTYAGTRTSLKAVDDHPNHQFVQADICDETALARALSEFRPERIIHLAAETHVDRSITGAKTFLETNVIGTLTLLELALLDDVGPAGPRGVSISSRLDRRGLWLLGDRRAFHGDDPL